MNPALAEALVSLAAVYSGIGLLFAVAFAILGARRIDPAAAGGSVGFRILILPGAALLWPLLARRWVSGRSLPPQQHDAHADAAGAGARP